jgi:dihydrofolate reductase
MRRVRYGGAMSLDGFIAGPNGEYDWIVHDPDIDFSGMMKEFDTFLIGRKTFDAMKGMGNGGGAKGVRNIVFSRTLKPSDHPGVRIERDAVAVVSRLRGDPGRDIAVFGGGELARSLLDAGLVDTIEMSLIPVLIGGGVPLVPPGPSRVELRYKRHRLYSKTGTLGLEFDVVR